MSNGVVNNATELLGAERKVVTVPVDYLKKNVRIRELDGSQRDEVEDISIRFQQKGESMKQLKARMIAYSVVDDEGNPLFDLSGSLTQQKRTLSRVNSMPAKLIEELWNHIIDLNGMNEQAIKEEIENFTEDQNDMTGTE